ncbi:hypothetical protein [Bdellovibrio sp. KM01]|uniref:hypothetical protein n=1 Tax=Bdellovibrio sp. KM01 TaxID=2748865 RepID=UPI0015EA838E|nr:hypothetical protein [Bdellovibrio sp. KM01]QLY24488.1 hypothetical protein HW988_13620 [Bdellovibrio sp. KM01]
MKAALFVILVLFAFTTTSWAQLQDLPNPGDEFPQPLPPDPNDPPPQPPQQPAPKPPSSPTPAPGRITIGDFVLSGPFKGGRYITGMVVQVSTDGRTVWVRDDDDYQVYQRESRYISKQMKKGPRDIWPGDKVLVGPFRNQTYSEGTVRAVYERGLFIVQENYDGGSYVRDQTLVAKRISCYRNLCAEDNVWVGARSGIIRSAFDSGKFTVMDMVDRKLYLRDYRDLKKK